MIGALLGLIVVGLLAVVLVGVVAVVLGLALKLLPFLLIGWLTVKLVRRAERPRSLSNADLRWLDSPNY